MEAIQKRPNRKRKAEEAEICQFDDLDSKRVKLSTTDDQITSNNSNSSSSSNEPKNPFVSFANQGIGFDSLINNKSSPNKQPSNNTITSPPKPSENKEETTSTNWSNNNNGNSNVFGTFDTFEKDSATSFGWNNNNTNTNVWGNNNSNEFKFDESNSQFSMADIAANNSNKNGNESENESPNNKKPIAKLMGVVDSGDTNDETIISIHCTVYELDITNNRYIERGNGIVKLNTYKPKNKNSENNKQIIHARLLCRQEVVKKTLINAVFIKETKFNKATEKSVRFTVFEQQQIAHNEKKESEEGKEKKDKEEAKGEDNKMETVNVLKSYLLKSKESDKTKIDKFLDEIKKIQNKM